MVLLQYALIGSIYSLLAFIFIIINLLVFVTVSVNSEFHTNTYRIIKLMIIGCLMCLIPHFLGGIMTITQSTLNYYVDRIFGTIIGSGWFLYQCAALTLAVDRALIFLNNLSYRTGFFIRCGFVFISFAMTVFYFVTFLCPGFGFTYASLYDWNYSDTEGSQQLEFLEKFIDFSILSLILLLYVIVFFRLMKVERLLSFKIKDVRSYFKTASYVVLSQTFFGS
ncbi:hypothetical protein L596_026781 [Steinernema carpocapsae]|uniref:7TM GPCR serpentine receptor class x (Srx) domain-containing protein n=1 Tax=Steinernema carpocapsae TaxID=34508 RepID=A0A4U5M2F2_STECR|nr:hypothetical protein L596_026781 [Steinernema carpocapsae]